MIRRSGSAGIGRGFGGADRKIKAQIHALEKGIEPELVSERIAELRGQKEALEEALARIGTERQETEDEELTAQLSRIPDLGSPRTNPSSAGEVWQALRRYAGLGPDAGANTLIERVRCEVGPSGPDDRAAFFIDRHLSETLLGARSLEDGTPHAGEDLDLALQTIGERQFHDPVSEN